jgi:hypothetical protein
MFDVQDLLSRGVTLATTDAQAREARRVLESVFRTPPSEARQEIDNILTAFEVHEAPGYGEGEVRARARIHYKNRGDWPILAAAIVTRSAIWTDDRDFFGVGVPVWTTRNTRFIGADHG